jgi:hypothetical protein
MMKNIDLKKLLPHGIAMVLFLILALAYFSPVLKGKQLKQGDIIHFKGTSKEIIDFREKENEEALWTNSMFSGMPAFQISVWYNGNLIQYVDKLLRLGIPRPADYVFLSLIGFYILMLVLGVNPWLGMVGAIAFAFSSYSIIILEAGHNSKAHAMAYMAPVLAGIILTFKGREWLGMAVTALFLALEIKANHFQITYYLAMVIIIYGAFQLYMALKNGQLPSFIKKSGLLIVAVLLAVSTNISNLWSTYEYGKYTTRGKSELTLGDNQNKTNGLDKDYATAWSYGVDETFTLIIPSFKGGESSPVASDEKLLQDVSTQNKQLMSYAYKYHGDQPFTSGPVYIGAIVCFLFILGLIFIKNELRWVMLLSAILSIMLSWGKNFMPLTDFFLEFVPGYNKFRAVSMILVIAQLVIPVLAIYTLDYLFKNSEQLVRESKKFFITAASVVGVLLIMFLMPTMFTDFSNDMADASLTQQMVQAGFPQAQVNDFLSELEMVRESMFTSDVLRSLMLIISSIVIIYLVMKNTLKMQIAILLIGGLILFDLWSVDKRFLNNKKDGRGNYISWISQREAEVPFSPSQVDLEILKDNDLHYRVYNTTARLDQDSRTSYFHKSLGGYHGAKLKKYQELIDYQITKGNMGVINMLNTKYFIVERQENYTQSVYNPDALGNAWFVNNVKFVPNADSSLLALSSFNPKETAVVRQENSSFINESVIQRLKNDTIYLTHYKPNYLSYQAETEKGGLAVFSEVYYPAGWKAYIDGEEANYFEANYILRAMQIPAGKHQIEFVFKPASYFVGEKIALASSLILILLFIGVVFKTIKEAA